MEFLRVFNMFYPKELQEMDDVVIQLQQHFTDVKYKEFAALFEKNYRNLMRLIEPNAFMILYIKMIILHAYHCCNHKIVVLYKILHKDVVARKSFYKKEDEQKFFNMYEKNIGPYIEMFDNASTLKADIIMDEKKGNVSDGQICDCCKEQLDPFCTLLRSRCCNKTNWHFFCYHVVVNKNGKCPGCGSEQTLKKKLVIPLF